MRTKLATLAVLAVALNAGSAPAQSTPIRGRFSFEVPHEGVRPAELTQRQKPGAVVQAHHLGYYDTSCYNYYRWYFDRFYGWQRLHVGSRCY